MKIILNNRNEEFENEKMTISELLKIKNFTFRMMVIKLNEKVIRRDEYDTTVINNNDKVDVIHLISGG